MKTLKVEIGFTKTADILGDAELGRLFRGMLQYASSGAEPSLSGSEKILWPTVKEKIDSQLGSFMKRSAANKKNVTKRYESLRTPTNSYDSYKLVEQREEEERGENGEKKSAPLEPPVKEKTQREGKEGEDKNTLSGEKNLRAREAKTAHGGYGWVKLTDEQYSRLLADLGEDELKRCITYVDEAAQKTGNKNKWKDWNLVIRSCHRDGWGLKPGEAAARKMHTAPPDLDKLLKDLDKI